METRILLLQVDCFESKDSKQWVVKKWYSNGNLYVYRFSKEQEYLNFINPLLQEDVVLVVHRYDIDDFRKYIDDTLELNIEL